ncbi:RraA family protein [Deinococcus sp. Leaf326]|uniref:RraA family protein n=1 Tax=Deinococcus sp. Leaf326 TaxID=1736338 RepID=UPI0007009D22|nr:diguanylate cyclase [Deinococcus sp. Leaf326]KQR18737.1 diguanylate cyclase [Deinococcus sp. Leaf326]
MRIPDSEYLRNDVERTSPELVARASGFAASILADVAGRRGTLHGRVRALSSAMRLAGPAITVEVRPGDNLMIHAAMAIAQPGDVLVIDGKGDQTCALMGEIMISQCMAIGLAGVVIDAAIRDSVEIQNLGFPVFSVGTNPNGPTKFVPGRVNYPISAGGIMVRPGDLVVADADGVFVGEREQVDTLLTLAQKKVDMETSRLRDIRSGQKLIPGWLPAALTAAGVLEKPVARE